MAAPDLAVGTRDRPEDNEMPRYEVVTHIAVELDRAMPEEAAAVFKREFLTGAGLVLRGLAVWPCAHGSMPSALPPPLQHQLEDFFAAVARHAAVEEAVFLARVEEIFAEESGPLSAAHGLNGGGDGNSAGHVERDQEAGNSR